MRYFPVDEERHYRVDCCNRCRRYLKTVDERVAGWQVDLLVEDAHSLHLDLLARERGYC